MEAVLYELIYELIYVLVISAGALSFFSTYTGLISVSVLTVLPLLILAALPVAFRHSRWTGRMIIAGSVITVTAAVALIMRDDIIREKLMEYADHLWLIAIAALGFAAGEAAAHIRPLRLILACLTLILAVISVPAKINVGKLFVASVLTLVVLCLTEEIQRRWHKQGYTDAKGHLVAVTPYILAVFILVITSPAPDEAYDWAFVKAIYKTARDRINDLSIRLSINMGVDGAEALVGFSDEGGFAESIDSGDKEVMMVSGSSYTNDEIRLTGKTFSYFDGHRWLDDDSSTLPDAQLDTISLVASLNDFTDTPENYIMRSLIGIRYIRMNTAHVFAPLKSVTEDILIKGEPVTYRGGDVVWPRARSYKTEYETLYYRMNIGNKAFAEYLRNSSLPSEESFDDTVKRLGISDRHMYTYEELLAHRDNIKKTYGRKVILSDRLREYMDSLYAAGASENEASDSQQQIAGSESGQGMVDDLSKLYIIEQLLRTFEYTLDPDMIPENVTDGSEFLDHFIFESRKGYCGYFATAFVLLARAEGIPARYAQGYLLQGRDGVERVVYSSMAHAWPEVYIDGAGWIPFEPTPVYRVGSYWMIREGTDEERLDVEIPEGAEVVMKEPEPVEEEEEKTVQIRWYMIVLPLALGLSFVVLIILIMNIIFRKRWLRMSEEERFITLCRSNLRILRYLGFRMNEHETLTEFHRRLQDTKTGTAGSASEKGDEKDEDSQETSKKEDMISEKETGFIQELEKYLYGGKTEAADAVKTAHAGMTQLMIRLKKTHRWRYYTMIITNNSRR